MQGEVVPDWRIVRPAVSQSRLQAGALRRGKVHICGFLVVRGGRGAGLDDWAGAGGNGGPCHRVGSTDCRGRPERRIGYHRRCRPVRRHGADTEGGVCGRVRFLWDTGTRAGYPPAPRSGRWHNGRVGRVLLQPDGQVGWDGLGVGGEPERAAGRRDDDGPVHPRAGDRSLGGGGSDSHLAIWPGAQIGWDGLGVGKRRAQAAGRRDDDGSVCPRADLGAFGRGGGDRHLARPGAQVGWDGLGVGGQPLWAAGRRDYD